MDDQNNQNNDQRIESPAKTSRQAAKAVFASSAASLAPPPAGPVNAVYQIDLAALEDEKRGIVEDAASLEAEHEQLLEGAKQRVPARTFERLLNSAATFVHPDNFQALIGQLRIAQQGWQVEMAKAVIFAGLYLGILGIEVSIFSEVLRYAMPPRTDAAQTINLGLMSALFAVASIAAYFMLKKASDKVRALFDKIGIGALLAYLIGGGLALAAFAASSMMGGSISDVSGWGGSADAQSANPLTLIFRNLNAVALGLALAASTSLSLGAAEACLARVSAALGPLTEKLGCKAIADEYEAKFKANAVKRAKLSLAMKRVEAAIRRLPDAIGNEFSSLYAPHLAKAQGWLTTMELGGSLDSLEPEIRQYSPTALREMIETLRVQTTPSAIRALILV